LPDKIIARTQRMAALLIALLEAILAVILAAGIFIASWKIVGDLTRLAEARGFDKDIYLHMLDSTLLLILAIDVTRTLLTAAIRGALPLRIVVEVATLAVLREFISIEIRNPSNERLLVYTVLFAVLALFWMLLTSLERRLLESGRAGRSLGPGEGSNRL
jgi:uncharacterized membrane protein (DUF373 family)